MVDFSWLFQAKEAQAKNRKRNAENSESEDKANKKKKPQVGYRQVSNLRRTKSRHFKDSRTVLRLSLPNPLKPDVKSRMKM